MDSICRSPRTWALEAYPLSQQALLLSARAYTCPLSYMLPVPVWACWDTVTYPYLVQSDIIISYNVMCEEFGSFKAHVPCSIHMLYYSIILSKTGRRVRTWLSSDSSILHFWRKFGSGNYRPSFWDGYNWLMITRPTIPLLRGFQPHWAQAAQDSRFSIYLGIDKRLVVYVDRIFSPYQKEQVDAIYTYSPLVVCRSLCTWVITHTAAAWYLFQQRS